MVRDYLRPEKINKSQISLSIILCPYHRMIFTRRLGAVTLKPRTKTKDDNEYIKDARMELSKGTDQRSNLQLLT